MSPMYWESLEEAMNAEPCGSVHPNHPHLVCDKPGKCGMDWHGTTYRNPIDNWTGIYVWGKDLEEWCIQNNAPPMGQLMRITEDS